MNSLRLSAASPLLCFVPTITHGRKSLHKGTHYTGAIVVAGRQSITGQPALFPSSPQSNPSHAVALPAQEGSLTRIDWHITVLPRLSSPVRRRGFVFRGGVRGV